MGHISVQVDSQARLHTISNSSTDRLLLLLLLLQVMGSKAVEPLDDEQLLMLRRVFQMFDSSKSGKIETEKVRTILCTMGHNFDDEELEALLEEETQDCNGYIPTSCLREILSALDDN